MFIPGFNLLQLTRSNPVGFIKFMELFSCPLEFFVLVKIDLE